MRPDDDRVVSNIVTQALSGQDITLYGDGLQTRSFCYVDDLVSGLLLLLDHPGTLPGPVNLGNPEEVTVAELAARVIGLTGAGSALVRRALPIGDPQRRCPDIARAHALLGWAPRVSLQEGLMRTISWFAQEIGIGTASPLRSAARAGA